MSFDALAWAGKCQPGSAGRKLVLLALADRHNPESNVSYPSIKWLAEWTGLNRKTVIAALDELESQNLIGDSGQRYGKTKQVKAYNLHIETVPKSKESRKRNSSVFSAKESQKRDTEPVREPVRDKAKALPLGGGKFLIPFNWKPPAVSALPPNARACAELWTAASYKTHAEAFREYWKAARRRMGDWDAMWTNRVIAIHAKVMGDQARGNDPKGEKITLDASWYREQALFYDRMDMRDEAAEMRRKAAAMSNVVEFKAAG